MEDKHLLYPNKRSLYLFYRSGLSQLNSERDDGMISQLTNEQIAERLDKIADHLETFGWRRGQYGGPDHSHGHCIGGANWCLKEQGEDMFSWTDIDKVFDYFEGTGTTSVESFNDHVLQDKEDAVRFVRRAAERWRNK